ncbi:MAG: hypothetical protein Q7S00_04685, partial [bacterium]|nr:hypothetical protein [bacterium]
MKSRTFLRAAQVFEPQDSKVCALYEQACESFSKRQESGEEKEAGIKEPESGGFTRIETQADPVDKSENIPPAPEETEKPELPPENSGERIEIVPEGLYSSQDAGGVLEEIDEENTLTPLEENPIVRITGEEEDKEDDSPDFYDLTVVDELEKEDFYDVIQKYGRTMEADEDIDEIVKTFGKDRNLDVPLPITERKEESGEDKPPKSEKEDSPEGGISAASDSKDNTPLEFGVIDDVVDDSNKEKILEINEEEEYDLSRYGFGPSSEDDSPVLSEEERKELMSLAESDETERRETED